MKRGRSRDVSPAAGKKLMMLAPIAKVSLCHMRKDDLPVNFRPCSLNKYDPFTLSYSLSFLKEFKGNVLGHPDCHLKWQTMRVMKKEEYFLDHKNEFFRARRGQGNRATIGWMRCTSHSRIQIKDITTEDLVREVRPDMKLEDFRDTYFFEPNRKMIRANELKHERKKLAAVEAGLPPPDTPPPDIPITDDTWVMRIIFEMRPCTCQDKEPKTKDHDEEDIKDEECDLDAELGYDSADASDQPMDEETCWPLSSMYSNQSLNWSKPAPPSAYNSPPQPPESRHTTDVAQLFEQRIKKSLDHNQKCTNCSNADCPPDHIQVEQETILYYKHQFTTSTNTYQSIYCLTYVIHQISFAYRSNRHKRTPPHLHTRRYRFNTDDGKIRTVNIEGEGITHQKQVHNTTCIIHVSDNHGPSANVGRALKTVMGTHTHNASIN